MTREEQKDRELRMKQEEARAREIYADVFGSEKGQWLIEHLKQVVGYNERVFTPVLRGDHHAYDPIVAAGRDGGRAVIIHIMQMLKPLSEEKPKPEIIK